MFNLILYRNLINTSLNNPKMVSRVANFPVPLVVAAAAACLFPKWEQGLHKSPTDDGGWCGGSKARVQIVSLDLDLGQQHGTGGHYPD